MYSGQNATWPCGHHISLRNLRALRGSASQLSLCFSASSRAAGIYGAMRRGGRTQSRGDRRGSAEDNLRQQHECIQVRMPLGRAANIFLCATSAVSAALRVNPRCVVSASSRATGIGGAMRRVERTRSRGDRRGRGDYFSSFLRMSRISVRSFSSAVGSGAGAGASSTAFSFFMNFMVTRRAMKMERAMIRKSTMFWMNIP